MSTTIRAPKALAGRGSGSSTPNPRTDRADGVRRALAGDAMNKRRGLSSSSSSSSSGPVLSSDEATLSALVTALASCDAITHSAALRTLRAALSRTDADPPTEELIKVGVIPPLAALVAGCEAGVAAEAAQCLGALAAGSHEPTMAVVGGAGAVLVAALSGGGEGGLTPTPATPSTLTPISASRELARSALGAIGNIAADSPAARAALTLLGVVGPLVAALSPPPIHLLRDAEAVADAAAAAWVVESMLEREAAGSWVAAGATAAAAEWVMWCIGRESGNDMAAATAELSAAAARVLAALCSREESAAIAAADAGAEAAAAALIIARTSFPSSTVPALTILTGLWGNVPSSRTHALQTPALLLAVFAVAAGEGSVSASAAALRAITALAGGGGGVAGAAALLFSSPLPLLPLLQSRAGVNVAPAVRCAALEALLAIAGAPLHFGGGGGGAVVYPLLGTVLQDAPDALAAAAAAVSRGYDEGATRAGLLLIDLTLHRWRTPQAIAERLPSGSCLCAASSSFLNVAELPAATSAIYSHLSMQGIFSSNYGPASHGTVLVEEARGREALESIAGDGPAWACDWAGHLLDDFFGEEEEE